MYREWSTRVLQVAVVALTLAAVFQELEKPEEKREWHGKVAGIFAKVFVGIVMLCVAALAF